MGVLHLLAAAAGRAVLRHFDLGQVALALEIRELLNEYEFPGDDIPIIRGSAFQALQDPAGPWGDKIIELFDAIGTGMLDFVQLSEQVSISKLAVPAKMIGKTVVDVNLRGQFGLNIIAIENAGKVNESVGPNTVFQNGDILFVSGGKNAVNKMADWLGNQ